MVQRETFQLALSDRHKHIYVYLGGFYIVHTFILEQHSMCLFILKCLKMIAFFYELLTHHSSPANGTASPIGLV